MFTKRSHIDVKKSTLKIQDSKKDSATRLRHLKTILEHVDLEEAKSLFETNFSHVYYILYDTFDQAETNLRQRVHKAHREELDGSLWLLGKVLCLLPELIAKRWQCNSLSRIMSKLIHHGNSGKLRREGVRYFLLWYQALGDNAPAEVHAMYAELVPGIFVPQKGFSAIGGPSISETEFSAHDFLNHPNLKGELGASVFHDTGAHPVKPPEIVPLLPPSSHERTAAPDPRDGIEILLENMIQTTGCLKWRDNTPQKHMKCFSFLLHRFREVYLPIFCPGFDTTTSIYDPKLTLPTIRAISKQKEVLSACVYVLVHWISKFTFDLKNQPNDNVIINEDCGENTSLLHNLKLMGYSQIQLIRDVLYSSRDTINFIHEVYRQAFLMNFTSKAQIESMKSAITVYRHWISTNPPPFIFEPEEGGQPENMVPQRTQRLRTDSYLGAMIKENLLVRAGLQNVLQIFITNAANVFMVQTAHLNFVFTSKTTNAKTTPLDEQTEICKRVLNVYRTLVMNARKETDTWEQLLLVLLQITSNILSVSQPPSSTTGTPNVVKNKTNTLGGRLAPAIFQTLIVTWIRAHTNVSIKPSLWEKFLSVLSSLTDREELINEWYKTMQILTRVLGREVYNINLMDLPLDRLNETKGKRRRVGTAWQSNSSNQITNDESNSNSIVSKAGGREENSRSNDENKATHTHQQGSSIPSTPALNRSYSEGSLAPSYRKARSRRRLKSQSNRVTALPTYVESSLNRMLLTQTAGSMSVSSEVLNSSRISQTGQAGSATLRRALSLDSLRQVVGAELDDSDSPRGSRSPSPTASSGIEGGSIKDSPMQIEMMAGDSSSIDTQEDGPVSGDRRRSILAGGTARGWQPDVASIMWKRMLGALGDVNRIANPKLHAKMFRYLHELTESLIKIKMNQGISSDNQTTPPPPTFVPPVGITAPWCYGAFALGPQYREGKVWALQLLCSMARNGGLGYDQLPLFYHVLHQALSGEDRGMAYTALRHLGGCRFLSLLFPGHSLLLLDLVHASTVILTSSDTNSLTPRAEVAGLLGSLLCFPKTSLPKPVLQPSETQVELMECPDIQELILNLVLRCARREPTSRARCIAIASLGQWILQNLTNPPPISASGFKQNVPGSKPPTTTLSPRISEAFQVLLQALQFQHRTVARIAAETLKLCAEKGKNIAKIERLPYLIVSSICVALEIQNVPNPKDADKTVITSLLLCLGEFCMSIPIRYLVELPSDPTTGNTGQSLIAGVLKILTQISSGITSDRIKLFTADEDFDMMITVDDVKEQVNAEANYQTTETIQNCRSAIRLCAKMITMHLVTNLAHFPMGIGASRLSSLVDEQDDLTMGMLAQQNSTMNSQMKENVEIGGGQVLTAPNLQMFLLCNGLVASFVELPSLRLPGGGITAGLVTANRQVRVLLRDLSGKACWDASILYKEPKICVSITDLSSSGDSSKGEKQYQGSQGMDSSYFGSAMSRERQQFFADKVGYLSKGRTTFQVGGTSLDPMLSTVGMPIAPHRHTLRHRPPNQLPVANDLAPDLDQLDDLLQYIGHTSPECLNASGTPLNTASATPLGQHVEAQTISILLNQRSIEADYNTRQSLENAAKNQANQTQISSQNHFNYSSMSNLNSSLDSTRSVSLSMSSDSSDTMTKIIQQSGSTREALPFQYCRLLFSQLGLAGWERRKRTHLLNRTDKLLRELRNLDTQKCRETHKMAVIYVATGQEDKNSILRNSCGSSTYEMFVSALGWEVELESHSGFLGGLPRVGCGSTAPYYATPFLEVIYHVATRMPSDTSESILNKTRHLGNDEVHIVWSEHTRDYRRDILPTEFCDILIVVYPLKSGLFRVTVNRKPEVPWFGPIWDETVVGGTCLASLVRTTAINASRAKRMALPLFQQFYEERNRSLDTVFSRHKESSTFEDFTARVFNPIPSHTFTSQSSVTSTGGNNTSHTPLAAALIDHRSSTKSKSWHQHPEITVSAREVSQQTMAAMTTISLDHPSPRPLRKLHPFKSTQKKSHHAAAVAAGGGGTPPDSPTMPGRKFK